MAQTEPPTIAAIRSYLCRVESGPHLSLQELAKAIDALVMSVHESPVGESADAVSEPPTRDYKSAYDRLGGRFTKLGYYGIADPLALEPQSPLIGDAIDDLADIGNDLRDVLWRYENLGVEDALWHFKSLFMIHWGQHARELSLYLHALIRAEG